MCHKGGMAHAKNIEREGGVAIEQSLKTRYGPLPYRALGKYSAQHIPARTGICNQCNL